MNEQAPAIGHNQPPLADRLAIDYAAQVTRRNDLTAALARMPVKIADQGTADKVADFIKQIGLAGKQAESFHKDEKAPFLIGGRAVDAFFKGITTPLAGLKKSSENLLVAWQRKIAEEERQIRQAAERKAREEAEAAEREAAELVSSIEDERGLEAAIEAEEAAAKAAAEAETAKQAASAKASTMTKTHTDSGTSSSMSVFWDFKDINPATIDLEKLRTFISADAMEKAVRAMVKSGIHKCGGVNIFKNYKSNVR